MNFSTNSRALSKALENVERPIQAKASMPILRCILFERDRDERFLRLTAVDIHVLSIVTRIRVNFREPSSGIRRIAIPAKPLVQITKTLGDVPVIFEFGEHFTLKILTDQGEYVLAGYDGGDFPSTPRVESAMEVVVPRDHLDNAAEAGGIALSSEEARPAMMGYLFQLRKDELRIVTTDGHRLVRTKLTQAKCNQDGDIVVPSSVLKLLQRLPGYGGDCQLKVSSDRAIFDLGDWVINTALVDSKFPNYERVIGRMKTSRQLQIDRESLLLAISRTTVFSSGGLSGLGQVRLEIQPDRIKISAEDVERAYSAFEELPCEYEDSGESPSPHDIFTIAFNANYLESVLKNIPSESVMFRMGEPNRACSVYPRHALPGVDLFMLIMPVMLARYN